MEQMTGFEPATSEYESGALPLSYIRNLTEWCGIRTRNWQRQTVRAGIAKPKPLMSAPPTGRGGRR